MLDFKEMINLFIQTIPVLESAFHRLEDGFEKPWLVKRGTYNVFRYRNQSIEAAVIQKLARVISGLEASLILLKNGFVQELGVLFRVLDEFNEDIFFLCQAIRSGELTELHKLYLESFYKEEFDNPDSPLMSQQKQYTVSRQKIHAALAKISDNHVNPSDAQELSRTLQQAYSGYVHGASVHILEMYCGAPPHYHLAGMLGTQRINEFTKDYWNYFYRGLIAVMYVTLSFGDKELLRELYEFRDYFEKLSGKTEWEHPEKMIKREKIKGTTCVLQRKPPPDSD